MNYAEPKFGQEQKILQIMPAPSNLFAKLEDTHEQTYLDPIVCLALTNENKVLPMILEAVENQIVLAEQVTGYLYTTHLLAKPMRELGFIE